MKILIHIDDRGNIASMGNGELSEYLVTMIEKEGWGVCSGVTCQQLSVHSDISDSHKISMCFKADIKQSKLEEAINFISSFLSMDCVLLPYTAA